MSSVHHNPKTKIKTYSSHVLRIVNLSLASSLHITSQSSMKSNRDSLSNMSLSRDGATNTSPLSYRQPSTILICPARLSKDESESWKMAIYSVMTIHVLVDPSQYWNRSCRSSWIGIHFQAPELYQETFLFLLQLWKKSWDESWDYENSAEDEYPICFLMIKKSSGSMRHGSYCLCWEYMQSMISKELQLVMSPGFDICLILIRCSPAPEKTSCQESGGIFPDKKFCFPFSFHQDDFEC
jgi:hypothetical protein